MMHHSHYSWFPIIITIFPVIHRPVQSIKHLFDRSEVPLVVDVFEYRKYFPLPRCLSLLTFSSNVFIISSTSVFPRLYSFTSLFQNSNTFSLFNYCLNLPTLLLSLLSPSDLIKCLKRVVWDMNSKFAISVSDGHSYSSWAIHFMEIWCLLWAGTE